MSGSSRWVAGAPAPPAAAALVPGRPPDALGGGSATTADSSGRRLGRVRDGHRVDEVLLEPRLDGGLDLLDPADHVLDLRARAARFSSAIRAPVPAALPADVTCSGAQSGTMPRTSACTGSMCAPNAPASRIRSTGLDAQVVHQEAAPGVQRGLRQLDLPNVVLGDDEARRRPPAARRRTSARRGSTRGVRAGDRAVDHAVGGEHAGQEQLGDRLDDPRAADAGDRRRRRTPARPTSVVPDHPEARLERLLGRSGRVRSPRAPPAVRRRSARPRTPDRWGSTRPAAGRGCPGRSRRSSRRRRPGSRRPVGTAPRPGSPPPCPRRRARRCTAARRRARPDGSGGPAPSPAVARPRRSPARTARRPARSDPGPGPGGA